MQEFECLSREELERLAKQYLDNLTSVQERCTELLLESRTKSVLRPAGEKSCVITEITIRRMQDDSWRAQAVLHGRLPLSSPVMGQQNHDPPIPFVEGWGSTPQKAVDALFLNLGRAFSDLETFKIP